MPGPPRRPTRNALNCSCPTFYVYEVVQRLFQSKLFYEESLLFFRHFFEEVFEVAVPYFCNFGEEGFADWLAAHISEHFTHEKVVVGDVRVFRAPFGRLEVDLLNGKHTEVLS